MKAEHRIRNNNCNNSSPTRKGVRNGAVSVELMKERKDLLDERPHVQSRDERGHATIADRARTRTGVEYNVGGRGSK